jgi:hypothetical protein
MENEPRQEEGLDPGISDDHPSGSLVSFHSSLLSQCSLSKRLPRAKGFESPFSLRSPREGVGLRRSGTETLFSGPGTGAGFSELFTGPAELASHPLLASAPSVLDRPILPHAGDVLHGMKPISKLREGTGEPEVLRIERRAPRRPRHLGDGAKLTDGQQSSSG